MTAKARWILTFSILALALAILAGVWLSRRAPPVQYLSATARPAEIEVSVMATGVLEPARLISVGSQVSGQLKALHVGLGQKIKAGALIAEVDDKTQINTVESQRAGLRNVEAQRRGKLAALAQAEQAFARESALDRDQVNAAKDLQSATASLAIAKADVQALDAQIDQARVSLSTALVNLGFTKIRAPVDATIVAVLVREGQTLNAGLSTPVIVKLGQLERMTVKAQISEADVIRLHAGQVSYFTILGDPHRRYYGRLRAIEPAPEAFSSDATATSVSASTDGASRAIYYNGLFEVDNADGRLLTSMTAQVVFVVGRVAAKIAIPASALGERQADGGYIVTVLDARGRPNQRRVRVGLNNRIDAEILQGLKVGERVVVGTAAKSTSSSALPRPPAGPGPSR